MRCDDFALTLKVGDVVPILRSDKVTITHGKVIEFSRSAEDRRYIAPEIPTFRVEFPHKGTKATRWCSALDIRMDLVDTGEDDESDDPAFVSMIEQRLAEPDLPFNL